MKQSFLRRQGIRSRYREKEKKPLGERHKFSIGEFLDRLVMKSTYENKKKKYRNRLGGGRETGCGGMGGGPIPSLASVSFT